ncbi:MAG: choice-of-anchor D domain-containing protein, partial [Alphaproteobacteria bacterium]|nr:choice-of-anchor D domain-containing protein [Alphaproteobacteria bacterium]
VTLAGGGIIGGIIQERSPTDMLRFTTSVSNLLNGVEFRGDLNLNNGSSNRVRIQNGLVLRNEANTGNGTANLANSAQIGFQGTQTFNNGTINLASNADVTVETTGSALTLGAGAVVQGSGGVGNTQFFSGGATTLTNLGTIRSSIAGQQMTVGFTNTTITNAAGGTLTGGTWEAVGAGAILQLAQVAAPIVTNAASITVDGVGSVWRTNSPTSVLTTIESSLATNNGTLRVLGNRNWTSTNAFSNTGTLQLGGGTFDVASLSNSATGTIRGFGTLADDINTNAGTVRAEGGTLNTRRIIGGSGTVQIDAGASLNLSAATGASSADFLIHNGTSLNLGANNFIVANDYTNANFGTGNAFNARANVSGTGQINTSVAQAQSIAKTGGDGTLAGGTTATPSINFGNVRIGESKTININVGNTSAGATAALHGAFKTTGLTPGLFSGSVVGAGGAGSNWDAAAGGSSAPASLTFTAASKGALAGQQLQVVNNFANVAAQTISIGANGYLQANPTFGTLDFGSVTAGTTKTINLVVNNVGTIGDAFQEGLNASWGTLTNSGLGTVTTLGGPITNLAAGLSNGTTLQLQLVAGTTAGAVAGNVQVLLQSNGTGTSGLGNLDLAPQLLAYGGAISGVVTNLAAGSATPTTINFGNKRVGDVVTAQALTITNTAAAPAEGLNASFGTPSNAGILAAGTVSNVAAGASNTTSMTVGMNTASVGNKSGTVAVDFTSNVSGGSPVSVGSQAINVTGSVFRLGTGSAAPTTVNLGNFRLGGAAPAAQTVQVSNSATNDGFSE